MTESASIISFMMQRKKVEVTDRYTVIIVECYSLHTDKGIENDGKMLFLQLLQRSGVILNFSLD
jgi:hypothetical protein